MTKTDIIIPTSTTTRLTIGRWDAPSGRVLVALTPEYQDQKGEWRLARSSVSVAPADAPALAAAILEVSARIDGAPIDPAPTDADRELSRRP